MPGGYNLWGTDPNRSPLYWDRRTPEPLIDEFNAWMNQQPWWQQIRGTTRGDLSRTQRQDIARYLMNQEGLPISNDFEIDAGGNVNQKGRVKRNIAIGAGVAAAVATGFGAAGLGPLAGALGGSAAGAGAAAPALGGGATLAANLGSASALPAFGAAAAPALGGGATLAANLGTRSALPAFAPAGAAPTLSPATSLSQNLGPASRLPTMTAPAGGLDTLPSGRPTQTYPMPKGQTLPTGGTNPFGWAGRQLSQNWQSLVRAGIPLGALAAGRMANGGGAGGGSGDGLPPELQQLLAMSLQRMRDQEPLFQAVNQQAFAGLPAYVTGLPAYVKGGQ
jgi:hypothetical protein